jgi:hypothetical protein
MISDVVTDVAALILGVAFCIWFVRSRAAGRRKMIDGMFTDRYGTCLSCGREPVGHLSWMLGVAIASKEPNRRVELERSVEARDWDRAKEIRELEGTEDEIEYRAIRCPSTNEISMKKILTTFALWSNDRVLEDLRLARADQERVSALAGEDWTVLKPGT